MSFLYLLFTVLGSRIQNQSSNRINKMKKEFGEKGKSHYHQRTDTNKKGPDTTNQAQSKVGLQT